MYFDERKKNSKRDNAPRDIVKSLLPKRGLDMHKGSAGRVLIVAGSPGMAGAAVLAAGAALRSGAGLVFVSIDENLWPIIQTHEPCAVCVSRDVDFGAYDSVAIGPGLGTGEAARATLLSVVNGCGGKLVLDADALNIIASNESVFSAFSSVPENISSATRPDNTASAVGSDNAASSGGSKNAATAVGCPNRVITPHLGEAARLLGIGTGEIQSRREEAVRELAQKYGAVAVLKGNRTLVASPSTDLYENTTGNPGMATAGSGDVLTGVIASFAAQGMSAKDAATCGVFIHGMAGDIAAAEKSERGMIATDIMAALPAAIKQVQGI